MPGDPLPLDGLLQGRFFLGSQGIGDAELVLFRLRSNGHEDVISHIPGKNPEKAQGVGWVKISIKEPGPLIASLLVESDARGCRSLKSELRIYDGSDYLEIINLMNKAQVLEKESVHFAFPFDIPGGTDRLDLGWAIIRPESDQIPGSCKDYFCVQNSVDISNQDYRLSWVSQDASSLSVITVCTPTPTGGRCGRRG